MNVARDFYLKQLVDSMWDGQVKVITGLRRCGKSYLLKPFALCGDSFRKIVVRDDIGHRFFDDSGVLNISLVDFLQDSTGAI